MPEHTCDSDSPSGGCTLCYRDMFVLANQVVAWMTRTDQYHVAMRQLARFMTLCRVAAEGGGTYHQNGLAAAQLSYAALLRGDLTLTWPGELLDPEDRDGDAYPVTDDTVLGGS